ncbi:MAG TPA: ATP-binding protein [Burkholderiaceae bacterium]
MNGGLGKPPRDRVAVGLPARPSSLPAFMQALEEVCRHAQLDRETINDLLVVLDEVCANVFKHAYAGGEPGPLHVTVVHRPTPHPGVIGITLVDKGMRFNPLSLPEPDLASEAEDRPIGGLGVHLMRRLTDEQSYVYTSAAGNQLTLIKNIPAAHAN